MKGTWWKLVLDIATLLGGLSALLFFFDRLRRRLRVRSGKKGGLPPTSAARWFWSAGTVLFSLICCSSLGLVGYKFGMSAYFSTTFLVYFGLALLGGLARQLGFDRLDEALGYTTISTSTGCFTAASVAILLNASLRGREDAMTLYPGSPLSLFTAFLSIIITVFLCFGYLRFKWLGDPWS